MNEWKVNLQLTNESCKFRDDGDGCGCGDYQCTRENCEAREDDEPITAEWLLEMGAEDFTRPHACYAVLFGSTSLDFDADGVVLVVNIEQRLPHIKTRQQFKSLYLALSGKELGG